MNPASFESPPRKKGRSNPVIVFRLPFFCPLILLCFLVIFLEKFFLPFVESRRVVWGASGLGGHRPFQKRISSHGEEQAAAIHAVAGNAITSARFIATGVNVTRCACAMLCSRRKWP